MAGFKKAQRKASKFKGSIQGASGSGKTFSALKIATELVRLTDPGKRIAVIDTEKSAELYSPPFDFDVDADFGEGLKVDYNYKKLISKLEAARNAGIYGAVVIDSMTHFWKEAGGFTRMIDAICDKQRARGGKGDSFGAWKEIDPLYRELMNYIRTYPIHVLLCIRAKQAYEDTVGANGKKQKVKIGVEPEFRDGFEFELDAQFAIDADHVLVPLKHRLLDHLDGKIFRNPGADVADAIVCWINDGAPGAVQDAPVEPAPVTNREPPVVETEALPEPVTEQASVSLKESILARMRSIATEDELKKLAAEANGAKKEKLIVGDDWTEVSKEFSAKMKELKAA